MSNINLVTRRAGRITVFVLLIAFCSMITFAQNGGIKGKVRNPRGGGIAGATVTARQDDKDIKTVRSDAKGNFLMQGLQSGVYSVVFDADGYSSGVKYGVEIRDKNVRDLGDRLILSVDPGTQVILKGSVFFKEGFSVTGAKIKVEQVNADGSTKDLTDTYTSSSGEFAFRPPTGATKLRVTAKYKDASSTKEIEIGGPAIYRIAITLDISKSDK